VTAELVDVAPRFVETAHRIVWATVATVDGRGRPRSRILHPIWEWDGTELVGWIATSRTPVKVAHLAASPYVSVNYWSPEQDIATAECGALWCRDDPTRQRIWDLFRGTPEPLGYDPMIVPAWRDGPLSAHFAVLRLAPWRLRVFPGSAMLGGGGTILDWADPE
jgi:hypothetical protein